MNTIRFSLLTSMVVIALAFGTTACGDKTPSEKARTAGDAVGNAAKTAGDAVGDAAKTTGDAVGDAVQATAEFLNQPKDVAIKAAEKRIDEIEQNWHTLMSNAAPTTDEAKVELQDARDEMDRTLATARAQLVEARDASDEEWQQDVKPALDTALKRSQKLYKDSAARFGTK